VAATGLIRIAKDYPHSFQYQSGERFFPMGDTAYFLIAQPTNVIARFIDSRRAHQFNFIRMMPLARGHWAFGGTPLKPDYAVINESAMRKLDWVFDYAASKDMNIELIIFGYGLEQGEGLWANKTNQNFWIDTLAKRYKGRTNLFMWTVANEFERYPDASITSARRTSSGPRPSLLRFAAPTPRIPSACILLFGLPRIIRSANTGRLRSAARR